MITTGLLDLHSAIRYIVLAFFLASLFTAFRGLLNRQTYSEKIRKLHLSTRVLLNLQMLIGLTLYILRGYYSLLGSLSDLPEMTAFFTIAHILGMIIGISLVNIGYQRSLKSETDYGKFKRIAIFYGLGFLVIFLMIPWPFFHSWATWF